MIRAILASPWMPLLYWTAASIAMIWGTHQESSPTTSSQSPNPDIFKVLCSETGQNS